MRLFRLVLLLVSLFSTAVVQAAAPPPMPITIAVDARTPWTRRVPVRLTLPAKPGKMTLVYPRWLPGMHAIEGPLENVARLVLTVDGAKPLAWTRDPYDAYQIHIDVPKGARTIQATYDYVPPAFSGSEVFYGVAASRNLAVLNPSAFALAPVGNPKTMPATLRLSLPKNWTAASALDGKPDAADPDTLVFAPVSLYTLIDSPILAGAYRKTIALPTTAPGDVPHTLDLFGEDAETLKKEAVATPLFARLVAESQKLFGVRHYRAFHFMLALTDTIGRNGLEHHESVLYVLGPNDLDPGKRASPQDAWNANLIPHEFAHSWNGKFRRPYGQDVSSNIAPQSSDLIWMYEGLTEYLGEVLMVRSGFRSPDTWRRDLTGRLAASREGRGSDWQSLADAALSAPHTYVHGSGTSLRPTNDIYYDSAQVWLEADAILRRESKGARSLDDFCRIFFGGPNRGAEVIRYTRKDIVDALNRTLPYAWDAFIADRFYAPPPSGKWTRGIEAAGWKLSFGDAPDDQSAAAERDLRFSLGATVSATDGRVSGVGTDSIAARSGLMDGVTVLGVNGFRYTPGRLREAIKATKGGKAGVDLLVLDRDQFRTIRLIGLDGERFPSLVRDPTVPDHLSAIATGAK